MKHTSCGLQNHEGSHPQRDSLAACLGGNNPHTPPEGANFDAMSNDPQAFNTNISTGDTTLFAPLLQEDLTKLPPPFTITNRLNKSDFPKQAPDDAHNTFLNDLESIEEYFK